MTHQLHEGGQADTGAHHVRGKGVSKPMGVGERDAGGLAMVADKERNPAPSCEFPHAPFE